MPTTKIVHKINNKRIHTKFSIKDSQSNFMIIGNTVADCEAELNRRLSTKQPIQPLIFITGSIIDPNHILVYFDGVKYQINSFLTAVDICFKIFMVFNLEYPVACKLVWKFIQFFFYKISTKYDEENVHIKCLISNLNKKLNN